MRLLLFEKFFDIHYWDKYWEYFLSVNGCVCMGVYIVLNSEYIMSWAFICTVKNTNKQLGSAGFEPYNRWYEPRTIQPMIWASNYILATIWVPICVCVCSTNVYITRTLYNTHVIYCVGTFCAKYPAPSIFQSQKSERRIIKWPL